MSSASASVRPTDGSIATWWIFSGLLCATSSMSMPPSDEAISTTRWLTRSVTSDTYSSFLMSAPSSISRRRTFWPSGPVWCVISCMPMIWFAYSLTCSIDLATLTPPPLPRPPAWICALTTQTGPPSVFSCLDGLFDRHARNAARNRHSEFAEDFFALILMDFHAGFPSSGVSRVLKTSPAKAWIAAVGSTPASSVRCVQPWMPARRSLTPARKPFISDRPTSFL
jgi:hypothetical protein